MPKPISDYTSLSDLRQIMANAKSKGRDDVWREAFRRLCALQGLKQDDALSRDFYQTLAAYEELLSQKNGRRTVASRTRQKLKNKGIVQCLEDWATQPNKTLKWSNPFRGSIVLLWACSWAAPKRHSTMPRSRTTRGKDYPSIRLHRVW